MTKKYTLEELAKFLSTEVIGDKNCVITGLGSLSNASVGHITFLNNSSYIKHLNNTNASAVIIKSEHVLFAKDNGNFIISDDPYLAYAKISALFDDTPKVKAGIHSTAVIGDNCNIDESVSIGPYCVIGNRVNIGKSVRIEAGCIIGDEAIIGEYSRLCARVVLYHKVKIGKRNLLHSGVVIGADGFGNANDKGCWCKIYQVGTVVIGDDVEIGANTTVDRGAIENTVIGNGVRLDNQIQIGHNVNIGDHTAIAGCVGIAGSTKIGRYCMIGGGVGINGHINITDGVIITGKSAIAKSINQSGIYSSGIPAIPHRDWGRVLVRFGQLENIVSRLKELEKEKAEKK